MTFISFKDPSGREFCFAPDQIAAFGNVPTCGGSYLTGVLLRTGVWIPMHPEAISAIRQVLQGTGDTFAELPAVRKQQTPDEIKSAFLKMMGRG